MKDTLIKEELIKKTLEHWDRMIKFAEKWQTLDMQDDSIGFFRYSMGQSIGEEWYADSCPLCNFYYNYGERCSNCILDKKYGSCTNGKNNKWNSVDESEMVGEWLENAKAFRLQIVSLLEGVR